MTCYLFASIPGEKKKNEKSAQRDAYTARQKFSPRRRPGAQDRQNLIGWRWSLPSPTDSVWWWSMHAILSYRGNRHRPPAHCKQRPPQTHTHRQDWLQYTAPLASAQCNYVDLRFVASCIGSLILLQITVTDRYSLRLTVELAGMSISVRCSVGSILTESNY